MFNKKNKKKEQEAGASLPDIHVVICTLKGGNYPIEILEFDAIQNKDEDFNMFAINGKMKWREELERKRHYIIDHLLYKLNASSEIKENKLIAIDVKIKELEDKIKNKTDAKKETVDMKVTNLNDNHNLIDLQNDVRHYKVLRYTVDNAGEGSYEIINKNGKREMRFLARDGIFHPYFYRSDSDKGTPLTLYPDISLNRKYYREVDEKITDRYLKSQDGNFFAGIKGVLITIAIVLLVIANIMWASNNYQARNEIDAELDVCRAKCVDSATDCAFYYGLLIQDDLINRSVSIPKVEEDKKTTGSIVDLTKKITNS